MRKDPFLGNSTRLAEEPSPRHVLTGLLDTLRRKLPSNWFVAMDSPAPATPTQTGFRGAPDAELTIHAPDGSRATVMVETKRRLDPRLVPVVADQLARYQQRAGELTGMVAAPFLSPRTRELLTEAGLAYADGTGNLRLVLERPVLYIETTGASSDPWAKLGDRPLRSLKGPTAGRVVRALRLPPTLWS